MYGTKNFGGLFSRLLSALIIIGCELHRAESWRPGLSIDLNLTPAEQSLEATQLLPGTCGAEEIGGGASSVTSRQAAPPNSDTIAGHQICYISSKSVETQRSFDQVPVDQRKFPPAIANEIDRKTHQKSFQPSLDSFPNVNEISSGKINQLAIFLVENYGHGYTRGSSGAKIEGSIRLKTTRQELMHIYWKDISAFKVVGLGQGQSSRTYFKDLRLIWRKKFSGQIDRSSDHKQEKTRVNKKVQQFIRRSMFATFAALKNLETINENLPVKLFINTKELKRDGAEVLKEMWSKRVPLIDMNKADGNKICVPDWYEQTILNLAWHSQKPNRNLEDSVLALSEAATQFALGNLLPEEVHKRLFGRESYPFVAEFLIRRIVAEDSKERSDGINPQILIKDGLVRHEDPILDSNLEDLEPKSIKDLHEFFKSYPYTLTLSKVVKLPKEFEGNRRRFYYYIRHKRMESLFDELGLKLEADSYFKVLASNWKRELKEKLLEKHSSDKNLDKIVEKWLLKIKIAHSAALENIPLFNENVLIRLFKDGREAQLRGHEILKKTWAELPLIDYIDESGSVLEVKLGKENKDQYVDFILNKSKNPKNRVATFGAYTSRALIRKLLPNSFYPALFSEDTKNGEVKFLNKIFFDMLEGAQTEESKEVTET